MPEWFISVWPVAAFFLGGTAAQFSSFLGHRRQRTDAERQRREDFELSHLVEVNALLRAYVDAMWEATAHESANRRDRGRQGVTITSAADLWEPMNAAHAELIAETGFILNDSIRGRAEQVREMVHWAAHNFRTGDDDPEFAAMEDGLEDAYRLISSRVRAIYAGQGKRRPLTP